MLSDDWNHGNQGKSHCGHPSNPFIKIIFREEQSQVDAAEEEKWKINSGKPYKGMLIDRNVKVNILKIIYFAELRVIIYLRIVVPSIRLNS